MGSRRDIVVLGSVLFALAVIALLMRPAGDADNDDPRVSSFLTGANGAAALYMLLEELDVPADRLLRAWDADSTADVLVMLAPSQPPAPAELEAIRTWIEAGGTLLYGAGGARTPDPILGIRLQRTRPDTLSALATVRWSGVAAFPEAHAWTAGVDSIPGFELVFAPGSRALQNGAVLMRTAAGDPAVIAFDFGAGRVIAWSDASVLANRSLRVDDGAALLFVRAADDLLGGDAALLFDEYHHGYREARPLHALIGVLTGTGGGRALLQALVACLALLLLAGARFGAPVIEHSERRRSPIEHVHALAGAYERSAARRTARRMIVAGLERQLGRRVLSEGAVLPAAALESTAAGRRLKEQWERGEEGDLADLARAVDEFVMEVRRWK